MTRRTLLASAVAAAVPRFRFALANDAFSGWPFEKTCGAIRQAGFAGIELAPATVTEDPARLGAVERRALRNSMLDAGLQLAALHSVLESPPGLRAVTSNAVARRRAWDQLRRLIDLTADLGDSSVLVLDAGRMRSAEDGMAPAEAEARIREGLLELAPAAGIRGVTVALAPLPRSVTNLVNTLEEAARVVRRVNSSSVRIVLAAGRAAEETLPAPNLLKAYAPLVRHVHASELNADFQPMLQAMRDVGYAAWVTANPNDVSGGPQSVLAAAAAWLRRAGAPR